MIVSTPAYIPLIRTQPGTDLSMAMVIREKCAQCKIEQDGGFMGGVVRCYMPSCRYRPILQEWAQGEISLEEANKRYLEAKQEQDELSAKIAQRKVDLTKSTQPLTVDEINSVREMLEGYRRAESELYKLKMIMLYNAIPNSTGSKWPKFQDCNDLSKRNPLWKEALVYANDFTEVDSRIKHNAMKCLTCYSSAVTSQLMCSLMRGQCDLTTDSRMLSRDLSKFKQALKEHIKELGER